MAATPLTKSPIHLPSYARATIASQNRNATATPTRKHLHSVLSISPAKFEVNKLSTASTISSNKRATRPRTLRFLDLPAEIRNSIYGYIDIDNYLHVADLAESKLLYPWQALPPLLQVSRQICDEAGSYYFAPSIIWFDIRLIPDNLTLFKQWLHIIGEANRKRLFTNRNVTISIVPWRQSTNNRRLAELAKVAGLGDAFEGCLDIWPTLREWRFCSGTLWTPLNYDLSRAPWLCQNGFRKLPEELKGFAMVYFVLRAIIAAVEGKPYGDLIRSHLSQSHMRRGRGFDVEVKGDGEQRWTKWKRLGYGGHR